jgi:hypothetical protein
MTRNYLDRARGSGHSADLEEDLEVAERPESIP